MFDLAGQGDRHVRKSILDSSLGDVAARGIVLGVEDFLLCLLALCLEFFRVRNGIVQLGEFGIPGRLDIARDLYRIRLVRTILQLPKRFPEIPYRLTRILQGVRPDARCAGVDLGNLWGYS